MTSRLSLKTRLLAMSCHLLPAVFGFLLLLLISLAAFLQPSLLHNAGLIVYVALTPVAVPLAGAFSALLLWLMLRRGSSFIRESSLRSLKWNTRMLTYAIGRLAVFLTFWWFFPWLDSLCVWMGKCEPGILLFYLLMLSLLAYLGTSFFCVAWQVSRSLYTALSTYQGSVSSAAE